MLRFDVGQTEIRLHFGFFAVSALVFCLGKESRFLPFLAACVLHELGHVLSARLCGTAINRICFGGFGIRMEGNLETLTALRRTVVLLSGPLANFLGFLLCLSLPKAYSAAQLCLFVFHILPALPLDGGTALCSALTTVMEPGQAERFCTVVSCILGMLLGSLGFSVLLRSGGNFSLLAAALYILFYIVFKPDRMAA